MPFRLCSVYNIICMTGLIIPKNQHIKNIYVSRCISMFVYIYPLLTIQYFHFIPPTFTHTTTTSSLHFTFQLFTSSLFSSSFSSYFYSNILLILLSAYIQPHSLYSSLSLIWQESSAAQLSSPPRRRSITTTTTTTTAAIALLSLSQLYTLSRPSINLHQKNPCHSLSPK